jgi:hypothetical protein
MTALRCRGSLAFPPSDRTFEARTHDRVRHRVRPFGCHDLLDDSAQIPFEDTCRCRPARLHHGAVSSSTVGRTPLMGFVEPPLHRQHCQSSLPNEPSPVLRWSASKRPTRSVHVVPPDSDGFLLLQLRRSVAPCSRSWGSPCFNPACSARVPSATVAGSPLRRLPFEAFPLQTAVTRHRVRCPHAVVPVSDSLASATLLRRRRRARFFRSLDLKAFLRLQSRCERSTVASRVLPVAPLGFSFWCVSCPTRRSSELRAHHRQTVYFLTVGDFSFTLGGPRASSHRRRWC